VWPIKISTWQLFFCVDETEILILNTNIKGEKT